MDRRFGYFILVGLVLGGVLGLLFSAPGGKAAIGLAIGALVGLFIGWFAAAADQQRRGAHAGKQ